MRVATPPVARRAVVAALLSLSVGRVRRCGSLEVDVGVVEDRLIQLLQDSEAVGAGPLVARSREVDGLINDLERTGGSQRDQTDGIGSWGSWIGAWDVLYVGGSPFVGGPVGSLRTKLRAGGEEVTLRCVSARQFVYGPQDAAEDLSLKGRDGGTSTELVYAMDDAGGGGQILLTRSGAFTKMPGFDFRLDFAQPPRAYRLSADADGSDSGLRQMAIATTTGVLYPMGGASLREISYLSERLWISRSNDDGGRVVLLRSDARALVPPAQRPDLTATCAEAIFVRGAVCRTKGLF